MLELTVSKGMGAARREASARTLLKLTPPPPPDPDTLEVPHVPRGVISRGSAGPHTAAEPLSLTVVLAPGSETAAVAWSSPDVDLARAFDGMQLGELDLTVPAALLPLNAGWATFYADLSLAGLQTRLAIVVPLNRAPMCKRDTCIAVTVADSTYPRATARALATGFVDQEPASLTYDFGVQHGAQLVPEATGLSVLHYTFRALPAGNTTVYVCAVDSAGGRACSWATLEVSETPSEEASVTMAALLAADIGSSRSQPSPAVCRARRLAAAVSSLPAQAYTVQSAVEECTAELAEAAAQAGSVQMTLQVSSTMPRGTCPALYCL